MFGSDEELRLHCESFLQKTILDILPNKELDSEARSIKTEDSADCDIPRNPLEILKTGDCPNDDITNSVLEEEPLDLFDQESDLEYHHQAGVERESSAGRVIHHETDKEDLSSIKVEKDEQGLPETHGDGMTVTRSENDSPSLANMNEAAEEYVSVESKPELGAEDEHLFEEPARKPNRAGTRRKRISPYIRVIGKSFCRVCQAGFKTSLIMEAHVQEAHGIAPFQCHMCTKPFKVKTHMRNHLDSVHGLKHLRCGQCKRPTDSAETFMAHMQNHHPEVKISCPICMGEVAADSYETPQEHIDACVKKRLHENYELSNCHTFKRKISDSEGEAGPSPRKQTRPAPPKEASIVAKFKCRICQMPFRAMSKWENHMLELHNTPAHECSVCGETKIRHSSFLYHMDREHGQRRFKCSECSEVCHESGSYFDHVKQTHPEHLPYCPACKENVKELKMQKHFVFTIRIALHKQDRT